MRRHDTRSRPAWPGELQAGEGTTLFLTGNVSLREDEAVVGPGAVELLVRAPAARESLGLTLGGAGGFAHPAGRPPLALRPSGAFIELPLTGYHEVRGRDRRVAFSRGYLWLEQEAVLRPTSMEPAGSRLVDSRQWLKTARRSSRSRTSRSPTASSRRWPACAGAFYPGPTGLLGPNGAGKTTLLKTLLGFLTPDAGRMTAFGKDPTKQPLEVRRRLGYMPEQDCHIPGMTRGGLRRVRGRAVGPAARRGDQPRARGALLRRASARRATARSTPTRPA